MVINGKTWTVDDLKKVVKSIKRKMLKTKSSNLVATFKEYKLLACLYS